MAGQDLNSDLLGRTSHAFCRAAHDVFRAAVNKYSSDDVDKWWPTRRSLSFEGAQILQF